MKRVLLVAFCAALGAVGEAQSSSPAPAQTTTDSVRAHRQGLAVWWMGNAGWFVKSDDVLVSFDLELGLGRRVHAVPATAESLADEIDVAFVSHHHTDHCNPATIRAIAEAPGSTLVLPSTCVDILQDFTVPSGRLIVPRPLEPFDVKGIHVEPIHAIHGNQDFTVLTREADFIEKMYSNCGYVVTIGGRRFLHPGDSVLTEEHLSLTDIDVLFVSPTVHNMYVDRSMVLINRLQPAHIFPQHFGTYLETEGNMFWTRGYPDELGQRLSADLQTRYHKLAQGEKFVID